MDPNWARAPHPPGRQNLAYQPSPIPFGILVVYQLYLVDISITYHTCATHNSLQLKIKLN